jgi:protein SPT2
MDDFIDDDDDDDDDDDNNIGYSKNKNINKYSNEIRKIFKYNPNKYKNIDDDIDNMESSYAQIMKEERESMRLGYLEDLEDMKKEEEEKKRQQLKHQQQQQQQQHRLKLNNNSSNMIINNNNNNNKRLKTS